MEQRKFKRFPADFVGTVLIDGNSYVGHLKNVSEEGVGYLSLLDFFCYQNEIVPKKKVTLLFEKSSNNIISLDCEIKWTNGHFSDSSQPFFGLKILNPPGSYKNLVNNLIV